MSMFHGIVMDVVEVPFKVVFISDGVLPKATLPQPTLFSSNS